MQDKNILFGLWERLLKGLNWICIICRRKKSQNVTPTESDLPEFYIADAELQ